MNDTAPGRLKPETMVTQRLALRPPVTADTPAIARLADNIAVSGMTSRIPHPYARADAERFVAWAAEGNARAMVLREGPDEPIGFVGIEDTDPPELGYWLGEPYWGRGYTTEAAEAMLEATFANPAVEAVVASCRTVNPGSRGVLTKCGFRYTGPGEMPSAALGGVMVATERYRLTRQDWALRNGEPA